MVYSTLTVFSICACLVSSIIYLASTAPLYTAPQQSDEKGPADTLRGLYDKVPYGASWGSWWHPQRADHRGQKSLVTDARAQGGGVISKSWNILYHLGGNGPWVEKVDGIVEGGIAVPEGCIVDQVHMMSRHAERYPTVKAGTRMLQLLRKIDEANITLKGDLAFANSWEYFTSDPQANFEQLTSTGPFAGTLGAFTTGVRLRTRYADLLPLRLAHKSKTSLWSCGCGRVIDTARYFSAGFFGLNWKDTATLHVIPEDANLGADTLTPGDTCLAYLDDKDQGHDNGAVMLSKFRATYMDAVRKRLHEQNPGIEFDDDEVYAMQEMCGFETTVRGSSQWCHVFTRHEWRSFEYARDVIHYYRSGPGTPYSAVMGWLWLNATADLLLEGPNAGPFFFSFVHDGDIVPLLAALDLFRDDEHLPTTHVATKRKWRTSQVTPMGGRVIFERLSCSSEASKRARGDTYVRVNINDGIVAIPDCDNGPGSSCPLKDFLERVKARGAELGDFREKCGIGEDMPDRITFLHQ